MAHHYACVYIEMCMVRRGDWACVSHAHHYYPSRIVLPYSYSIARYHQHHKHMSVIRSRSARCPVISYVLHDTAHYGNGLYMQIRTMYCSSSTVAGYVDSMRVHGMQIIHTHDACICSTVHASICTR